MVETITPDVCGSRRRQVGALLFFALGAIVASAGVGALLGVAGARVGAWALPVAALLALVGAAREGGFASVPLPQSRRQVPEPWRFTLPLPAWAAGYGAGLGLGFLTYQPVATFWVACAAAVALGRPVAGAVCFAAYGAGRSLLLLLPLKRGSEATAIVEALASRRRGVLRVNAVALLACAALLAAPAAGAEPIPLGPGSQLDPSAIGPAFAYTQRDLAVLSVVVRPSVGDALQYPGGEAPSLDGELLAYQDAAGIRVVQWATGAEVGRVDGAISRPALDWPWLAYRRELPARTLLELRDLTTGEVRKLGSVPAGADLGRPSIAAGRVAWHAAGSRGSRILLYAIASGRKQVVMATTIALLSNPSLSSTRILWIRQRQGISSALVRKLRRTQVRILARVSSQRTFYWTTDLYGLTAYVTRWSVSGGAARILRIQL
ncbi:MAG TPA: hypothetical protein VES61_04705 [Gaiellaceae bacterium]|nr:hypothetical protein [Gaiellaceae bacterium]